MKNALISILAIILAIIAYAIAIVGVPFGFIVASLKDGFKFGRALVEND